MDVLYDCGQLNSGKVVAVGPGLRDNEGKVIPLSVKEGDTVLLPEYGGSQIKLDDKEYVASYLFISCPWILLPFQLVLITCGGHGAGFICTGMKIFWLPCMIESAQLSGGFSLWIS